MRIAEVVFPGTCLDLTDRDLASEIEGILRCMEDRVSEVAIALSMFEDAIVDRMDEEQATCHELAL
ncbi:MAG: hypothetical protein HY899_04250 [Deltaproteobacteria bacterium]|nr:hypothetical protein [Deltaproteobacteria bacterium]